MAPLRRSASLRVFYGPRFVTIRKLPHFTHVHSRYSRTIALSRSVTT